MMIEYIYRNSQLEQELLDKINASATAHHGENIPADIADRIAMETRHILDNGHGTILAIAAQLAEFSKNRGYPVGFRGLIGNLYLSYLLGLAALDPLALGLRWEGCLGLAGTRMPTITINVAPTLMEGMTAYLGTLLPASNDNYPAIRLCPHALIGLAGEARRQAGSAPVAGDIIANESLIIRAYHDDVSGIPVLDDLGGFREIACQMEPKTFLNLTKIMGLCLSLGIQFQVERLADQPNPIDSLIGTREDVYDACVQHGIGPDDAFRIMQQVRGGSGKITAEYKDMIVNHGLPDLFTEVLDTVDYLYPRGQCADYLYWALTLL